MLFGCICETSSQHSLAAGCICKSSLQHSLLFGKNMECCKELSYIHPDSHGMRSKNRKSRQEAGSAAKDLLIYTRMPEYFRETGDGSLSRGQFPCLPFDALMTRKTGPPGEYAKKSRQRTVPCLLERAPAGRTTNQRSAFPAAADRCSCCYSKSVYTMTSALYEAARVRSTSMGGTLEGSLVAGSPSE